MIEVYKYLNSLSSQIINDTLKLRKNIAIKEMFIYSKQVFFSLNKFFSRTVAIFKKKNVNNFVRASAMVVFNTSLE